MMLPNIKYIIIAVIALVLLYLAYNYLFAGRGGLFQPAAAMPVVRDLGMYDTHDPNAFGTTAEADRRWENASVRKEFNKNLFPLAEGCGNAGGCAKKGCPDPASGDLHGCKCGPASKRMIDAHGGNHMLPHMCAPCTGDFTEPSQLGRWWKRHGCSAPESVGLNLRPICSGC
jgi:hypothetical protein